MKNGSGKGMVLVAGLCNDMSIKQLLVKVFHMVESSVYLYQCLWLPCCYSGL